MLLIKAKLSNVYSILKPHGERSRYPIRLLLSEAKLSYVYLILKPHSQSSKSPVRPLSREAKLSYVHTILTLFTARDFPTYSLQGVLATNTP